MGEIAKAGKKAHESAQAAEFEYRSKLRDAMITIGGLRKAQVAANHQIAESSERLAATEEQLGSKLAEAEQQVGCWSLLRGCGVACC